MWEVVWIDKNFGEAKKKQEGNEGGKGEEYKLNRVKTETKRMGAKFSRYGDGFGWF